MEALQKIASQLIESVQALTSSLPTSQQEKHLDFIMGIVETTPTLPYHMMKKIFMGSLSLLIEKFSIENLDLKIRKLWLCIYQKDDYFPLISQFFKEEPKISFLILGKSLEGIRKGDEEIKLTSISSFF